MLDYFGYVFFFLIFCRWDKYVISVREAKALPKTNSQQWKNKYICVEGKPFYCVYQAASISTLQMTHI